MNYDVVRLENEWHAVPFFLSVVSVTLTSPKAIEKNANVHKPQLYSSEKVKGLMSPC